MLLSSAPTQIVEAWAAGGDKNVVPVPDPGSPGAASWTLGFPPDTAIDPTSGGVPPSRLDMNGGLFEMSAVDLWMSAGAGFPYSSGFSTAIGGYPKGSRVLRATGNGYWLSTVDNNATDPDTGGAGWIPDRAVSSVYASAPQTLASGSPKLLFDTVEVDVLGQWNSGSQRFQAEWPGIYRISGAAQLPACPAGALSTLIFKNGATARVCFEYPQTTDQDLTLPFEGILALNATDYVEIFFNLSTTATAGLTGQGERGVYAQFEYLGAG
jgi:hypothetical protein